MTRILSILLVMLFAPSCVEIEKHTHRVPVEKKHSDSAGSHVASPPVHYHYNDSYKLYEVLTKDTIVSVAKKHKMTPEDLIDYNNLKKPYLMRAGQMLKIPLTDAEEHEKMLSSSDSNESSSTVIQIAPKNQ